MLALTQIVSLILIASVNSDALLSQPLTVRWRYESNVTNLTPAFDNERIFVPIAGGQLVALKAKDGQLVWRAEIGGELSASPVADENAIYVASETVIQTEAQKSSGALRALGREGGVTQWMTPLVRPLRGALALSHGKIFAGGLDGRAYAFDKRTGGVMWSIPYSLEFSGQPVVKDGKVYLGSEDGTLLALDEALERLGALDARARDVVVHRFFGGYSLEETADLLGTSVMTVRRDWIAARAWLRKELEAHGEAR